MFYLNLQKPAETLDQIEWLDGSYSWRDVLNDSQSFVELWALPSMFATFFLNVDVQKEL